MASLSCALASASTPRAPALPCPLQNLQMASLSCICTSVFIPRAFVLPRPLQHLQMTSSPTGTRSPSATSAPPGDLSPSPTAAPPDDLLELQKNKSSHSIRTCRSLATTSASPGDLLQLHGRKTCQNRSKNQTAAQLETIRDAGLRCIHILQGAEVPVVGGQDDCRGFESAVWIPHSLLIISPLAPVGAHVIKVHTSGTFQFGGSYGPAETLLSIVSLPLDSSTRFCIALNRL
eukprot:CAMPEP_0197499038 /NCGR_PEP_ID=MMETSP1311-20131121/60819_1 /TAXON_ID=464262 /ORGANISM="Genus nov. species nov., Strain RCC856" /LENGTH=232 /DNA_ID=CAMNT_0043044779 /DNA_START=514 /DNA_END=1211 /DNA_ORIENTATION=-